MPRPVTLCCTLLALASLPLVALASTGPTAPTFLLKWGQNGNAPASLNTPSGITTDALGNVYVCDQLNHRIQKFDRLGNFMAQWGSLGAATGQFNQPFGVVVDATGFVYVVDNGNRRVQKFTSAGAFVLTWGSFGSGDGQFSGPLGLALDAAGNVYVADQFNQRVQKFTSTGTFVTKWGSGGSGNGQFNIPAAVATDLSGNVYVVDSNNHRIQKFTSSGVYLAQWGGLGAGDGQLSSPIGVAVDAVGIVYVVDRGNNRIQKFTADGVFLTKWGTSGAGNGQFATPLGVTVDVVGDVYITEQSNHRVQKFSGAGVTPSESVPQRLLSWSIGDCAGVAIDASGRVYASGTLEITRHTSTGALIDGIAGDIQQLPTDVATDPSGNFFVAFNGLSSAITPPGGVLAAGAPRVVKYDSNTNYVTEWSVNGQGLGTDASGNVYVADPLNNRILKYNNTGGLLTQWGTTGTGNLQFNDAWDVAADAAGNVYVVDRNNHRVQKFTNSGGYITQWGGLGSGPGQFNLPTGVHVDAAGNVYVTEHGNDRIQKFTGAGAFLMAWNTAGSGNGQMANPSAVVTDPSGNLYVADTGNGRVQKFFVPATIAMVSDVRNDQGRSVRLRVLRSSVDAPGSGITIPRYDVFRRVDGLPAPQGVDGGSPSQVDLAGWDPVGSFSAYGESEYNVVVPTLADATAASLEYSAYMVRAMTGSPLTFYDSGIANGYSIDNLAPGSPAPLFAVYDLGATHLHWAPSTAPDFETFRLHRGSSSDFVPGPGNLIATLPDTGYADPIDPGNPSYWYKLTAVDRNGNASPYAAATPTYPVDVPEIPVAFALDGVRPVPTSGERLFVQFALASDAPATLELIDVTGRRARSRAGGGLGAGRHVVDLAEGGSVARGVWFVRLTQGPNEAVVRAIVLD